MRSFLRRLIRVYKTVRARYAVEGLAASGHLLHDSMVHYARECSQQVVVMWERLWMRGASVPAIGRWCTRLASMFSPALRPRVHLARYYPHGYVSPRAVIRHTAFHHGSHVYIGDDVALLQDVEGQTIELADGVELYGRTELATGSGGSIRIGAGTHIQEGCRLIARLGSIHIGALVDIAPNCAFYSYNHGMDPYAPPMMQPLVSKGDITIEDGVWLGYGVVVLSGVRIGRGAVIGAGTVVCTDIPEYAIAGGVPARVIRYRHSTRHAVGQA
jgi:acetyltransferase-like isoleucine patch superfamily enzyme